MIVHAEIAQGTEQWRAIRDGKPTASQFKRIISPTTGELKRTKDKKDLADVVYNYAYELLGDCFVTDVTSGFTGNRFTDRGTELEPMGRQCFAETTGLTVTEVGFITRDDGLVGCSPDGLIIDPVSLEYVAGLEVKCLLPKEHVEIVAEGKPPADYMIQCQGGIAITGLPWYFISFCPGMQPFICKLQADDYTRTLSAALDEFVIMYSALAHRLLPKLRIAAPAILSAGPTGGCSVNAVCETCHVNYGNLPAFEEEH